MQKLEKVKLKDLKPGPLLDKSLPDGFIDRVIKFKEKLSEVETTSLEETVLNFQRDHHPERELQVWEWIADNYVQYCENNANLTQNKKKKVFSELLRHTLGM